MSDLQIELRNVKKSFRGKSVLEGINLQIKRGESFAIIGGSGVGKSVILKCILGLINPDSGLVLLQGSDRKEDRAAFMERTGVLFQGGALFDSLPVWRNVAFKHLQGSRSRSKLQARMIAEEKLERVGLGREVADLYPSELSGGMQKRAGLARAIASDPEILFFDEPTTGLDPIRAADINQLLSGLVSDLGITAITVTHDMTCVRTIATRVGMVQGGIISWTGNLKELDALQDGYIHEFVHGMRDSVQPDN